MYAQPQGTAVDPTADMRSRLRPMGIGDILDETFRLYRANFRLFLAIVAVVQVPYQILTTILTVSLLGGITSFTNFSNGTSVSGSLSPVQTTQLLSAFGAAAALFVPLVLLAVVGQAIMVAALSAGIAGRYLNQTTTVGTAYRAALNRIWALVLALIWIVVRYILAVAAGGLIVGVLAAANLGGLAAFLGVLLAIAAIVLLIYYTISWILYPQAIMIDGATGLGATARSRRLISNYWWKTFGLSLIAALLVGILGSVGGAIGQAVVAAVGPSAQVSLIARSVGTGIVTVVVSPIQLCALTLLYYDLKIRKEAFDLETLATQAMQQQDPTLYSPSRY